MNCFDVFISYAVEDKHPLAATIASGLTQKGLKVYFVSKKLTPGNSVSETVYNGLDNSRYCIVILSRFYIRTWPAIERSLILNREKKLNQRLIFPVRNGITHEEATELFPELLDHYSESTINGIDVVVENLYNSIRKRQKEDNRSTWKKRLLYTAVISPLLVLLFQLLPANHEFPSAQVISTIIDQRIETFQQQADHQLAKAQQIIPEQRIAPDSVIALYNAYTTLAEYQRNNYSLNNGTEKISGYANIQEKVFPVPDSPHNTYGIFQPLTRVMRVMREDSAFQLSVAFIDTAQTTYSVDSVFLDDNSVHVWVSYTHAIRVVFYNLSYSMADNTRKQMVEFYTFKPNEEYILDNSTGIWKLQQVK